MRNEPEHRYPTAAAVAGTAPPALLSPPTRNVYDGLDLASDRVVWVEPGGTIEPGPLRGAGLAVAALPVDTTRPRVKLRVPALVRSAKNGDYDIPVTARCDEACDVRVEMGSGVHTVRALAAGERSTVRHAFSVANARVGINRESFRIIVSDRAGNTVTRSERIRVRVPNASIRSFKVGLRHDFWMVDAAGNRAVARFVNGLIDRLARDGFRTRAAYRRSFDAGLTRIARRHPEVRDYEVRDRIDAVVYIPTVRAGL